MRTFSGHFLLGADSCNLDAPLRGPIRPVWGRFPWYLPAFVAMGLGLTMLLQPSLFVDPHATPAGRDAWRTMRNLFGGGMDVWGILFLFVGSAHVALKWFDKRSRTATGLMLVTLFAFLAGSLTWSTGLLSTGSVAYGGYALLAIWAVIRPR